MAKQTTWLWPDHAISKAESRALREEHNALANEHAELLTVLRLAESSLSTYAKTGAFTAGQPSGWLLNQLSTTIAKAEGK